MCVMRAVESVPFALQHYYIVDVDLVLVFLSLLLQSLIIVDNLTIAFDKYMPQCSRKTYYMSRETFSNTARLKLSLSTTGFKTVDNGYATAGYQQISVLVYLIVESVVADRIQRRVLSRVIRIEANRVTVSFNRRRELAENVSVDEYWTIANLHTNARSTAKNGNVKFHSSVRTMKKICACA